MPQEQPPKAATKPAPPKAPEVQASSHPKPPTSTAGAPGFNSTATCIVLDDTGTFFRVRIYATQGDITVLPNTAVTFTDEDVQRGKLRDYLRTMVPGLL